MKKITFISQLLLLSGIIFYIIFFFYSEPSFQTTKQSMLFFLLIVAVIISYVFMRAINKNVKKKGFITTLLIVPYLVLACRLWLVESRYHKLDLWKKSSSMSKKQIKKHNEFINEGKTLFDEKDFIKEESKKNALLYLDSFIAKTCFQSSDGLSYWLENNTLDYDIFFEEVESSEERETEFLGFALNRLTSEFPEFIQWLKIPYLLSTTFYLNNTELDINDSQDYEERVIDIQNAITNQFFKKRLTEVKENPESFFKRWDKYKSTFFKYIPESFMQNKISLKLTVTDSITNEVQGYSIPLKMTLIQLLDNFIKIHDSIKDTENYEAFFESYTHELSVSAHAGTFYISRDYYTKLDFKVIDILNKNRDVYYENAYSKDNEKFNYKYVFDDSRIWIIGFWDRRYHEGNSEVVYNIIKEIRDFYQ